MVAGSLKINNYSGTDGRNIELEDFKKKIDILAIVVLVILVATSSRLSPYISILCTVR